MSPYSIIKLRDKLSRMSDERHAASERQGDSTQAFWNAGLAYAYSRVAKELNDLLDNTKVEEVK